ncbi:MAG: nucleotidyltransferase family protein [Candidatus Lokiarchaeota archaeon]
MLEKLEEIRPVILEILKRYEVKQASLFGSIVRGEMDKESNIDLLIKFTGDKTLMDLVRLKFDLEERLKCKVDVLTYDSLNPLLRDQIIKEQVEIL